MLSYLLPKICEKCDDVIKTIFAAYDTEIKKAVGRAYVYEFANGFAQNAIKRYFSHTFDEEALKMFKKAASEQEDRHEV